ncbi:MAG: hypothetical protein UZ15_CFX003001319 [Chloroflexi bacterium OLB15]|nr:MAG: hypothetical protein UZ15_CFX003001319 [Chloroflexi bacterium OLB15]
MLIPPTAWTDQAERTAGSLFIFLVLFSTYGITGWLMVLGAIDALITIFRRRWGAAPQFFILLVAALFFAAWWLFASYDERFFAGNITDVMCAGGGICNARLAMAASTNSAAGALGGNSRGADTDAICSLEHAGI